MDGLLFAYWPTMSEKEFDEMAVKQVPNILAPKFGKGMVANCFTEEEDKK